MNKSTLEEVIRIKKWLHEHPEVSNQEIKTQEYLKEFIAKHLSQYRIVDEGKWFYCLKEIDPFKKTIVLRADHDAIVNSNQVPFHGCGHDGHTANLLGLMIEDCSSPFNVIYLFQPAEENGTGAKLCSRLFERHKVDAVFGLHNMPGLEKNCVYYGKDTVMCASVGYRIELLGKQSHASEPEKGLNPAFVLSELVKVLEPLSSYRGFGPFEFQNLHFQSLVMATVIHVGVGAQNFGISPANGTLCLTLRAAKESDLKQLEKFIVSFVDKWSSSFKVKLDCFDRFSETASHPILLKNSLDKLEQSGLRVQPLDQPIRASEDFGYYSQFAPSLFLLVGAGNCPALHQDNYVFPEEIFETCFELFKTLIS